MHPSPLCHCRSYTLITTVFRSFKCLCACSSILAPSSPCRPLNLRIFKWNFARLHHRFITDQYLTGWVRGHHVPQALTPEIVLAVSSYASTAFTVGFWTSWFFKFCTVWSTHPPPQKKLKLSYKPRPPRLLPEEGRLLKPFCIAPLLLAPRPPRWPPRKLGGPPLRPPRWKPLFGKPFPAAGTPNVNL